MELNALAGLLGIEIAGQFDPETIVPEERIRAFCRQDKCGNYALNYMCPPFVGTIEEIKAKLNNYRRGLLIRYTREIDIQKDREGVFRTQTDFHHKILKIEKCLCKSERAPVWGLIGGNCRLCPVCRAKTSEPCLFPGEARMSLEAIGIDVLRLLAKLGLDNRFHADKITWTGCILIGK
jgi:predicted metal-binding protein